MSDTGAFRLGVYVCKEAEVVDFASETSGDRIQVVGDRRV